MEQLNLNSISDIVYRLCLGQSERRIAEDPRHSHHTVRHYHYLVREKGYLDLRRGVPEPEEFFARVDLRVTASVGCLLNALIA
jgi:hypothetical protein